MNNEQKQIYHLRRKLRYHKLPVVGVAISHNKEILVSSSWNDQGDLKPHINIVWSLDTMKKLASFYNPPNSTHIHFSPNDTILLMNSERFFHIYIFNVKEICTPNRLLGIVQDIQHVISKTVYLNEYQFISSDMNGQLQIWNIADQKQIGETTKVDSTIFDIKLSQSLKFLFCASDQNMLSVFKVQQKLENAELELFKALHLPYRSFSLDVVDKSGLVLTGHYRKIHIWNLNLILRGHLKLIRTLVGQQDLCFYFIKACPKQQVLFGCDQNIIIWSYTTAKNLQIVDVQSEQYHWQGFRFGMSSDIKQLAIGGKDKLIKIFEYK